MFDDSVENPFKWNFTNYDAFNRHIFKFFFNFFQFAQNVDSKKLLADEEIFTFQRYTISL